MSAMKILMKLMVAVLAICGSTTALVAAEKEEKISIDQVPPLVRKTIEKNASANELTIGEVTREIEHGKVVYEAEGSRSDGSKLEIEVAEDGKLLEVESGGR
jgi:hypothetical protein